MVIPMAAYTMDPFYYRAMVSIKRITTEKGYNCMLFSEEDIQERIDHGFHQGRSAVPCDGIIVFCPHFSVEEYLKAFRAWELPTVLIRRRSGARGITSIYNDDYKGSRLIMEHLPGPTLQPERR